MGLSLVKNITPHQRWFKGRLAYLTDEELAQFQESVNEGFTLIKTLVEIRVKGGD